MHTARRTHIHRHEYWTRSVRIDLSPHCFCMRTIDMQSNRNRQPYAYICARVIVYIVYNAVRTMVASRRLITWSSEQSTSIIVCDCVCSCNANVIRAGAAWMLHARGRRNGCLHICKTITYVNGPSISLVHNMNDAIHPHCKFECGQYTINAHKCIRNYWSCMCNAHASSSSCRRNEMFNDAPCYYVNEYMHMQRALRISHNRLLHNECGPSIECVAVLPNEVWRW